MNIVKTPKGTELPLISLKGKDYLMVAHRLVWFNETSESFHIDTDFLQINDEQTVAKAKVTVFNKEGREVKHATATKRETKKDFPDHTEKAETGAIGRALALMGYGTQFAIADLDEGSRLADAPVVNTKRETAGLSKPVELIAQTTVSATNAISGLTASVDAAAKKLPTFRKPKPTAAPETATSEEWT